MKRLGARRKFLWAEVGDSYLDKVDYSFSVNGINKGGTALFFLIHIIFPELQPYEFRGRSYPVNIFYLFL
jgi:hypothetical protein